ncbi:PilW family protein [Halanaerobium congolense]|uniref:Prepilin-type N-terminal cleavage/methylation domain-containing protein n=1 Tax=Halanaerobium congolense TaxID=54121 RepID=A0A4R7EBM2_9FIRM|nr:prepilin-type N-terminal cleavage/methylation domain-containing protein [Halanaerobium congolense]TDS31730.1 prepilin-type N-terminal cleavage/methylation domain-containing protein [Halanaerobium congolense]
MEVKNNEEGITLVELMVAIAIIGVVIAALYMSYFTAIRVFGFNQKTVEFHRDQRLISESLGKYIRSADEIILTNGNELLIKYTKDGTTNTIKFFNKNNYFYIDNDSVERKISQLELKSLSFNEVDGIINTEITLLNNNDKYNFVEQFQPRIKDVSILVTP